MPRTNVIVDGRRQAWLAATTLIAVAMSSSLPTFVVYESSGHPCILMDAKLQLSYPYNFTYTPAVDNATSACNEIVLSITASRSIIFTFEANTTSWWLNETMFEHDDSTESNSTRLFTLKLGQSYQCDSKQNVALGNMVLTITNWKVQAFNFSSLGNFDSPMHCSLDPAGHTINTVPIAVGAALAGLVIVTLVAYLVGRFKRRSIQSVTTGGYEPLPS